MLGDESYDIAPFDCVYVSPGVAHQFRATGDEPMGFLCTVDRVRIGPRWWRERPVDQPATGEVIETFEETAPTRWRGSWSAADAARGGGGAHRCRSGLSGCAPPDVSARTQGWLRPHDGARDGKAAGAGRGRGRGSVCGCATTMRSTAAGGFLADSPHASDASRSSPVRSPSAPCSRSCRGIFRSGSVRFAAPALVAGTPHP